MNNEIFSKNDIENSHEKEMILSNCSFKRFAGGFEIYQELINSKDEKDRDLIINRMRKLYAPQFENMRNDPTELNRVLESALTELLASTLEECESGNFNKNNFAEKISTPPLYNLFSAEWNHKANDVEKNSGMNYVNELIAHRVEDNDTISLHLRPSNVEGKNISEKRRDGYGIIAKKIESGEIEAQEIIFKSWLYGREFEDKTKQLLGDDINIEDVLPDDKDVEKVQFLGLQYNNRLLKKYLEAGEKPEVRQIIMTSSEFLQKFS